MKKVIIAEKPKLASKIAAAIPITAIANKEIIGFIGSIELTLLFNEVIMFLAVNTMPFPAPFCEEYSTILDNISVLKKSLSNIHDLYAIISLLE